MKDIFKKLTAKYFFLTYMPEMKSTWRKKMSGKNSNGNPVDFSEVEKQKIKELLPKMLDDILRGS